MDIKNQLITDLDGAHQATQTLLRDLEIAHQTTRELYPTWTVKELLSHLTGWDDACIAALHAFSLGEAPVTTAARGIDPYNASTVLEREALSLPQVIQEWEATRQVFLQDIREVPEDKVDTIMVFPWGPSGTLSEMVGIFVEHEHEHAQEIRKKILTKN